MTKHTVHNEGDTYHVAAVLKDRQEQEQDCHLRHEAKHSTQTADDTVNSKADDEITCTCIGEEGSCGLLDRAYKGIVGPVGNKSTNRRYGYVINNPHDRDEDRDTQDTVGYDLVDLIGYSHLVFALLYGRGNDFLDEFVTLVGYDALHIVIMLFFKLFSCGLYNAYCRCRKCHALNNLAVVLKEFDSVPSLFVSRNALRKDLGNHSDSLLQIF